MVAGILLVAAAFAWVSRADAGDAYTTPILPAALLCAQFPGDSQPGVAQ
jgi:hypothetical protein